MKAKQIPSETRTNLVFVIEAKFSPADAAELRPGQPVDVEFNSK